MMRLKSIVLFGLLALSAGLSAEESVQKQLDDLKSQVDYIKQNYERTEPVDIIKQVTEWVSPSGEIFREKQPGDVSPKDGSKLSERTTYRMMKFSRREAVGDKIDAAVSSAINGHVIVGLELVGSYSNIIGAGALSNRGAGAGSLDITFSGKPMRNTLIFVDLDAASGTPAVSEAWVEAHGPKKMLSLQAGVVDLSGAIDLNMLANDETTQFLTPGFVNNPLLMNPANGPGAILRLDLVRYQLTVGVQNALGSAVDFTDELYWAGELGMLFHFCGDSHWRVWGRQQPRGTQQPDQAVGVSMDHRFTSKFSVFGRYGKSSYVEAYDEVTDSRFALNPLDWHASGGLELSNFNPRNLKERLGLAYGRSESQGGATEDRAEFYNRVPLTPNFAFGFHYQAAFNRVQGIGLDALPDSHSVSLRVQATY
jgi:hypothetical protein